ncbi:diaminopimelate epimerase [Kitasatospora phosalacinea]|uniref:Diaminopimelate epimerase n=1 Tax=Kitasatospora phosalacinea TaxID=2065 RepID=A0A9W6QHC9_9ACTN|nr:diaminopimelate epimerase [Kitasatospora phosalacinea]GLW74487.1 diaminopimelate epimerase [Kitasatospora phosalacinea]
MTRSLPFTKGHGTENDFLLVPDPDGQLGLAPAEIVALCDRRNGIGADGLLLVVRSAAHPDAAAMAAEAEWFMDYRNPDGTTAQMCGNGIRVFARYLLATGRAEPGTLTIATRAGVRRVHIPDAQPGSRITVDMGRPLLPGPDDIKVIANGHTWPATHVDVGNPHAVVHVDDLSDAGNLLTPPTVEPASAYPDGVTVEFVTTRGPAHLALRVHERGVGETRSCGTGAAAAVAAARHRDPNLPAGRYTVDVPGGRLTVHAEPDGTLRLSGPAVLVADGTAHLDRMGRTGDEHA